jgi:opacity protein-like surface antigen
MGVGLVARKSRILAGFAIVMAVSASSSAFAQCTVTATGPGAGFFGPQLGAISAAAGASAGAFSSALGNMNTAFLSNQGSAFVSAPGDPKPYQDGGGVWARGVAGEFTSKFNTAGTGTVTSGPGAGIGVVVIPGVGPIAVPFPIPAGALNTNANVACTGSVNASFGGSQVGTDISKLNVNGWNIHLGTTAGYLNSHTSDTSGGTANIEVPFIGTYLVATHGRFFADLMVRREFYSADLTSPTIGLFRQQVGANGVSVSTSAGYNFALANNWFIEPSAGFIWSRTNVDSFNVGGGTITQGIVTTFSTAPIESEIGRLSLRVGTTVQRGNIIWQPFGSASVFHEFSGNTTTSGVTLNGAFGTAVVPGVGAGVVPVTVSGQNSTTRVGTYGQYSLGLAAQVANTGWLGFVRGDYKKGDNIEGWTANAGIRYQFTPELIRAVMPTKAPVKALAYVAPTNWTGFYVGGFLGAAYGRTDIRFVGDITNSGNNPWVAGPMGGVDAGYRYQYANNWVVGVEGDIAAVNLHGAKSCGTFNGIDANGNVVGTGFSPAYFNCQNKANWIATVAAQLGYSWHRTLFYVKGGAAAEDDHTNLTCIFGPLNNQPVGGGGIDGPCRNQAGAITNGFSTSGNRYGWLIGFGSEFDLGHNWSAKSEYTYIDFGTRTALATDGTTFLRDSGAISQVKVGLNYRFAAGPVVAKY